MHLAAVTWNTAVSIA